MITSPRPAALWFSCIGYRHAAYTETEPQAGDNVATLCGSEAIAAETAYPELCLNCDREWRRRLGTPTREDITILYTVTKHVNTLYHDIAALRKQFRNLERKISARSESSGAG